MAKIKEQKKIEIKRNPIEQFIMDARDYLKKNIAIVVRLTAVLLVVVIVIIAAFVVLDIRSEGQRKEYYSIKEELFKGKGTPLENQAKAIAKYKKLADSSFFGFTKSICYYEIGKIYFDQKKYKESAQYYEKFISKTSDDKLKLLAMSKVAVAKEEMGKIDEALQMYNKISSKYENSFLDVQVMFSKARLYLKKKDYSKARSFFNKVVSSSPQSPYSKRAKKHLFMLGAQ